MIDKVGKTAFIIAAYRSWENRHPQPLFNDPFAEIFLDDSAKQQAEAIANIMPLTIQMVRYRVKYFDDVLSTHLESGLRQVVILGAGFDTRALRFQKELVRFFEIDHREVLSFKESTLANVGLPVASTVIPIDYVGEDFIEQLKNHSFDPTTSALFVLEGNTMYLPQKDFANVLVMIGTLPSQSYVAFDYLSKSVINRTTGSAEFTAVSDRFASLGAPWITGIDNLDSFAREVEMSVLDRQDMQALELKYTNVSSIPTDIGQHYSMCVLRSGNDKRV